MYLISYDRLISIERDSVEMVFQDHSTTANHINLDVNVQYLGLFKVVNNIWSSIVGEGTIDEWNAIKVKYLHHAFTV